MKELNEARDYLIKNFNNNREESSNNDNESSSYSESQNKKTHTTNKKYKSDWILNRLWKVLIACVYIFIIFVLWANFLIMLVGLIEWSEEDFFFGLFWFFGTIIIYKLILATLRYIFLWEFNFNFQDEKTFFKKHSYIISNHTKKFKYFLKQLEHILPRLLIWWPILLVWVILFNFWIQGINETETQNTELIELPEREGNVSTHTQEEYIIPKNWTGILENETSSSSQPIELYKRTMLQNTNFRKWTNTNSEIMTVIKKWEEIDMSWFFYENDEWKWYEIDYTINWFSQNWFINEIAFKTDEELNLDEELDQEYVEQPIFLKDDYTLTVPKDEEWRYFDCWEWWTYYDFLWECSCETGYKKWIDWKCSEQPDCWEWWTYYDFLWECSCRAWFWKLEDGKCYR